MDQRAAFARARSFLNYHPTAKWSALAADIGAGILYVALLLLLGLFLDLVINPAEASPRAGRLLPWSRRGLSSTVEDLVYVDPLMHGRGVGKALLGSLVEEARGLGYRLMVAQVAADNGGGRALHESLGFTEVGVLHKAAHKFNVWIDVTLMERVLS